MSVAVKICGLSTGEAVAAALAGGAAYLGFVFYGPSPRNVAPDRVAAIAGEVPGTVKRVGLFVDADDATVGRILDDAPIDVLQFHGSETPERVLAARSRFGRPVMKALPIAGPGDVKRAAAYEDAADILLFDARPPRDRPDALPGGNGLAFDWQLLAGRRWRRPWMLSGGLNASVLAEAVRISGAAMVDVSSGVERAPGRKDPALIQSFLQAARRLG